MSTGDGETVPAGRQSAKDRVVRTAAALLKAVNESDCSGVLSVWCDDGVLMPPHHPSIRGSAPIREYFQRVFGRGRLEFVFGSSEVEVAGEIAVQRLEYTSSFWPVAGGGVRRDSGKGVHVFRREPDGEWRLLLDIWNSDCAVTEGTAETSHD
jgi:ketosteroid isomerase-like protein